MTHPFERILLATEHTEFDAGAERVAFALAKRCGLPLAVVVPVVSNPEYEAIAPQIVAHVERETAARIEGLRQMAAAQGVEISITARRGEEPYQEIVQEAAERKADLIVIRRRGKRGFLSNLLVGETVSKVVGHASCSVLFVPRAGQMVARCAGRHRQLARRRARGERRRQGCQTVRSSPAHPQRAGARHAGTPDRNRGIARACACRRGIGRGVRPGQRDGDGQALRAGA